MEAGGVNVIVGLVWEDVESMATGRQLDSNLPGRMPAVALHPGGIHAEPAHGSQQPLAACIVASAGNQSRGQTEGLQMTRHVEGGATKHGEIGELIYQHFSEEKYQSSGMNGE
jgi:hypothetical protein